MTPLIQLKNKAKVRELGPGLSASASVQSKSKSKSKSQHTFVKIRKKVGQAIERFPNMIEANDKIMVCISGGKDSYALLDVLIDLKKRAPIPFSLFALNIDQGWPGYDTESIAKHLATRDVPFHMINENYATLVEERLKPGQTPCSLCSRFRRGTLYRLASDMGATKIALGHHADDLIETLMMNMMFSGKLSSMPAVLTSDNQKHVVIRPMALVFENEIKTLSKERDYPIVSCGCASCGLPHQKRQVVKSLLTDLDKNNPGTKNNMLAAIGNVKSNHLLLTENLNKA